jgi:hypothetical protein
MPAQPAYRIWENERDRKWIVEISKDVVSREQISSILDYLMVESLRKKSGLTEDDADALAREVKRGAWERVSHLFEES